MKLLREFWIGKRKISLTIFPSIEKYTKGLTYWRMHIKLLQKMLTEIKLTMLLVTNFDLERKPLVLEIRC